MSFNAKQLEAINTINGPVMVVSCPGSGKTTVVVNRAKAIVDSGIPEERILVITFTKASADEMEKRYVDKYGKTNIHFSTIHSVCLAMLNNAYGFGAEQLITISEQYQIMEDWLEGEKIRELDYAIPQIYTAISYCNNRNMPPNELKDIEPVSTEKFVEIYNNYQTYKKDRGIFDFDDILILARQLLKARPDWLEYYQNAYQYLMIDEYQDTNQIQADIFYAIAQKHQNICVVGDDDQSIYGFRAADSQLLMNFQKTFPNGKIIYMDTNYRSYPEIIAHAGAVIQNNQVRFEKNFRVGRATTGGTVNFISDTDAVDMITKDILKAMKNHQTLSNYAILFRNNIQASLFINHFVHAKIPFKVADNVKDIHNTILYQDILTFYRLSHNQAQKYDFAKVMNKPQKYFAREMFNDIEGIIGANRKQIFNQIDKISEDWKRRSARQKMVTFLNALYDMKDAHPKTFFNILQYDIQYMQWIIDNCKYHNQSSDELLTIFDLLQKEASKYDTMLQWFDEVKRQQQIMFEKKKRKKEESKDDGVQLSTFHSSKGLEWDTVYIVYANEGITPSKKAITEADIEEERRLFYVAMTRAKEELNIFYDSMTISRFVEEAQQPIDVVIDVDLHNKKAEKSESKSKDIVKKKMKKTVEKPTKSDDVHFVFSFGPARNSTLKDTTPEILDWYKIHVPKRSKFYTEVEQILRFEKKESVH